ncbi:hypothetical protein OH76DRAFT_1483579 [Lentinus brumalis]|uniref:Uncharacterized protein n=1 Tax=Lentinus brumalis TaxID=2498619 RepID=A0A371D8D7_9APHY|nr:hypothetical protein OH76DRAFT_1483579 [Polyporus brumalis]
MSTVASTAVAVWRESDLDEFQQICKSKALAQYKLREKDLEGLHFWTTKKTTSMGYNVTTHLYSELEVEQRAWERYGGPEAFETFLQKKYDEHLEKPRPRKNFVRPDQYGRGKLKRKAKPAARPPPRTDPYIKRSKALWNIHDSMPTWLWKALNETLDFNDTSAALRSANGTKKVKPQFDTDKKRETALLIASQTLPMLKSREYALRPEDTLPASPTVDALRAVLSDAPELPQAAGADAQGLDVHQRPSTGNPGRVEYVYEWDDEYLDRLWYAIACVVRERGAEGWAAARWEVYDTCAETIRGFGFHSTGEKGEGIWSDPAAKWLEGGFASSGFKREAITRVQVAMLL